MRWCTIATTMSVVNAPKIKKSFSRRVMLVPSYTLSLECWYAESIRGRDTHHRAVPELLSGAFAKYLAPKSGREFQARREVAGPLQ